MPGGVDSGPFRKAPSGGSSRSSVRSCRSARGTRSVTSLGGSSRGSARNLLRAALNSNGLSEVAGKLGQEASQRYGSLSNALKSVKTDNRGGVARTEIRNLGDEYGITIKESDLLFDTLDVGKEGTVNLQDFTNYVSQKAVSADVGDAERGISAPPAAERARSLPPSADASDRSPRVPADSLRPISPRGGPMKMTGCLRDASEHNVPEHVLNKVGEDISHLLYAKHGSLPKAFNELDVRKARKLNKDDIMRPLLQNGYDELVAQQFFDHVSKDKSGGVDYQDFLKMFSHAFGDYEGRKGEPRRGTASNAKKKEPAERSNTPPSRSASSVASQEQTQKMSEHDVKTIFDALARKTAVNHTSVRKAFFDIQSKSTDQCSGITRDKMRVYMKNFGYDKGTADHIFNHIDKDSSGKIEYTEFREIFGPYIMPEWTVSKQKHDNSIPTQPRQLKDTQVRKVVDQLGNALRCKYKSVQEFFRTVDIDGSGTLDRDEVRDFFAQWSFDKDTADKFLDAVDSTGTGECSRNDFAEHFTPYIIQGFEVGIKRPPCHTGRPRPPQKIADPALDDAVDKVSRAFSAKFPTILKAWRAVDEDKDGKLATHEVHKLFRDYGFDNAMGDRFVKLLNTRGKDHIDYGTFQEFFAPHIYGWSQLGEEGGRVDIQRDHYDVKDKHNKRRAHSVPPQPAEGEDAEGKAQEKSEDDTPSRRSSRKALLTKDLRITGHVDSRKALLTKDIEAIFRDVAAKTARRSKSVGTSFKKIQMWGPPEQTNDLNRAKFTDYIKLFGYDHATADQVFDHVDKDGSGQIDYQEFQEMFGPYILPTWTEDKAAVRRDLPPSAKAVSDKKMSKAVDDIGKTITKKYRSAHDCFRTLDSNNSGTMSKADVRVFFNKFAYPVEVADEFFDKYLTQDDEGLCDYREFTSHFTPYVTQGFDGRLHNRGPGEQAMAEIADPFHRNAPRCCADKELNACLAQVGENAAKKFGTIRRAWRSVDLEKDGFIDRKQLRHFFNNMGFQDRLADKFFDYVNQDSADGVLDYHEFSTYMGPQIYGWSQLGQEDARLDKIRGHYDNHARGCKWTQEANRKFSAGSVIESSVSAASTTPRSSEKSRHDMTPRQLGEAKRYEAPMTTNEVKRILRDVGTTMGRNTASVHKAFNVLNKCQGPIDRQKFTDYMAKFGYDGQVANQVFDHVDKDGSGGMDYKEFQEMLGPYVMPEWSDKEQRPRAQSLTIPPPRELKDAKLKKVIRDLGTSLSMKYRTAHDVFRTLDAENEGSLSKEKVRGFFGRLSYPKEVADQFYATFPKDKHGEISSNEFTSYFTPYLVKSYDGKGVNEVPVVLTQFKKLDQPEFVEDPELRKALPGLEAAIKSKFPRIRDAFRVMDQGKDGALDRKDLAIFLARYGYSQDLSHKFFKHLNRNGDDSIDYAEFQTYFAPIIYGWSQLGVEGNIARARAASEPCYSRVGRIPRHENPDELRHHDSAGRGLEMNVEKVENTQRAQRGHSRTPGVSDRELNKVVTNMCETMRARHGDSRTALKRATTSHKDYMTRGDVHKLFRNYGYGDVADQFFERLDGNKTGGVDYNSFQNIFAKHIDRPDGTQSGQSTYRAAFGG